ncbi:MAG: hypothetical protein RL757_1445 [Bacteroidota bacterium]|jgi:electron transfer flavoprotein alpha subunit
MVLVFAENTKGNFKKTALEVVTYGAKTAASLGTQCVAVTIGAVNNGGQLGEYGASKVFNIAHEGGFDSQVYTKMIAETAQKVGASVVILAHSSNGKALAGRLAVRLDAGLVSGANALPNTGGGAFSVRKGVFSGKAIGNFAISSAAKVISVIGNSVAPEQTGAAVSVESLSVSGGASRVRVRSVKTSEGIVPLPEAELVVSGGRGFKGPENFGIMEELAQTIGATTACSRPVADSDWRPHHEHVGQTGIAIRPNLYIAIGISGAIQHLAGVNNSRTIVVINKDAEAPFFKAADYGVVGDLFEIVPRLTEAFKKFKANN